VSAETEAEEVADAAARAVAALSAAGDVGPSAAASAVEAVSGGRTDGAGWGRRAGVAGAAVSLLAAGVAVERLTVNRAVRRKARLALDAAGPYGSLRGTAGTAYAEDGTALHYETDDCDGTGDAGEAADASAKAAGSGRPAAGSAAGADPRPAAPQRRRLLRLLGRRPGGTPGPGAEAPQPGRVPAPPPTVVFTHGYCLSQDVWHFQRAALRGTVRSVYWDQRSHGRSGRGAGGPVTIDQLGRDLKAVLDAAAPEGPLVLVGHSMGGMTVMALAAQYPDFVAERVAGAAFIGTSAGGLGEVSYGLPLPAVGVKAVRRAVPGVLRALVSQTALVERGRRAAADLFAGLVKRYSFGKAHDVDPGVARFAERLIESVPIDVVAEFYPAFEKHEKTAALAAFDGRPALVLAGEDDLLTPSAHSETIARALPSARLCVLPDTGHLSMLERPQAVNEALAQLIARAVAYEQRAAAGRTAR
jgi:pimeloyl-ACP methyl ester carboxylesterase